MAKVIVKNQKGHYGVEKDPIISGCFTITLEMVDAIYGNKRPLRYPLMLGISDRKTAQKIANRLGKAYLDALNTLYSFEGLVPCATCEGLFLPKSITFVSGKNYCPSCSAEATLTFNMNKVRNTLEDLGVEPEEIERRIALVTGGVLDAKS